MNHDPLCPMSGPCLREYYIHTERWAGDACEWCDERCRCDLIAKVREDATFIRFDSKDLKSVLALRKATINECIAAVWESGLYDMEKEGIEEILRALMEKP